MTDFDMFRLHAPPMPPQLVALAARQSPTTVIDFRTMTDEAIAAELAKVAVHHARYAAMWAEAYATTMVATQQP